MAKGRPGVKRGRPGSEDRRQWSGEPRQHILAIERLGVAEQRPTPVGAIHPRLTTLRIDHPDEPVPAVQPVSDLRQHCGRAVTGRQNLDDQVGCQLGVADGGGVGKALARDERDVRGPHGVWIGLRA